MARSLGRGILVAEDDKRTMAGNPGELGLRAAIASPSTVDGRFDAATPLHLAKAAAEPVDPAPLVGHPLAGLADPRWVLALRTAEVMEGAIVRPEKRRRLLQLGKMLGLSPFDSNLVVAIMQDQARRGHAPSRCPAAGEQQLTMVPLPDAYRPRDAQSKRRRLQRRVAIAATVTSFLATELFLVWWLFF